MATAVLVLLRVVLLAGMGLFQWQVLRGHVRAASRWVAATAESWLVALRWPSARAGTTTSARLVGPPASPL
ncbi:hypothetical protein [Nonomuraea basaltis]|uniref:hypothetical protein n=1 Tax=Nonomuraea basaltis TaxID=2495887 RepID=UPI00110C403B|nr:hypothetical protein [Nonomuraea basaltis]TMR93611.1 hypothetical protein EJK15_38215 [Nonomuraea basaltis]